MAATPIRRRNARGELRCSTCRRYLSPDAFHRNRNACDGRNYECRACRSALDKRRYNRLSADAEWYAHHTALGLARRRRKRARDRSERLAIVRLADARLAATGLLQRERAELMGVSVGTLINWRAGRHCPEPAAVERCLAIIREGARQAPGARGTGVTG